MLDKNNNNKDTEIDQQANRTQANMENAINDQFPNCMSIHGLHMSRTRMILYLNTEKTY